MNHPNAKQIKVSVNPRAFTVTEIYDWINMRSEAEIKAIITSVYPKTTNITFQEVDGRIRSISIRPTS